MGLGSTREWWGLLQLVPGPSLTRQQVVADSEIQAVGPK